MERSLVLIKPDAMQRGLASTIISRLEKAGLRLVAIKMLHLDKALAQRHYAIHSEKPFFEGLVNYITSAPIIAAVLEGEQAVGAVRKIMGPTDPAKAEPGTIRGDYSISVMNNVVHSSATNEEALIEIQRFFKEGIISLVCRISTNREISIIITIIS